IEPGREITRAGMEPANGPTTTAPAAPPTPGGRERYSWSSREVRRQIRPKGVLNLNNYRRRESHVTASNGYSRRPLNGPPTRVHHLSPFDHLCRRNFSSRDPTEP